MPNPRSSVSAHFTWGEMLTTQSRDPLVLQAQANPSTTVQAHLIRFCAALLEPARATAGRLQVSSGYRCPRLNDAIGGSRTSAHMAGQAADVHPLDMGLVEAFEAIAAAKLWALDQLILEFGRWIHIGGTHPDREPRRELLMIFEPGRYLAWNPNDERVKALREVAP